ncbi:MAG: molybdopterin-dependent oxidoreductase [Deltaproteobacteria bacterium]|nr:molybdopterin-dependent oxidoreductase [Deltaproteobacteria bacterium]
MEKPTNAYSHTSTDRGDVDAGFAAADLIVENTYHTSRVHQAYLEPHNVLVHLSGDRVEVWACSKAPYNLREALAAAIGVPEEDIVVNHSYIGGDFGGKATPADLPIAYYLAKTTGRPVRMVSEYVEEFMAANPRHSTIIRLKTGVKRDGTIMAHEVKFFVDAGAYAGFKPRGIIGGANQAVGPYRTPSTRIESTHVYTNTVPGGHMRSPGEPQAVFAIESHVDEIALSLGMDPLEFRLKNVYVDGDLSYWGEQLHSVGLKETLTKAAEAIEWGKKDQGSKGSKVKRGKGIACISKPTRTPTTSTAAVLVDSKGKVTVLAGTVEIGQGCNTILSQVAAEELRVPIDKVDMAPLDTDAIPFDASTTSSRSTYHMGNGVRRAAVHAREQLAEMASPMLESHKEDLLFCDGKVSLKDHPEMGLPIGEVIRRKLGTDGVLRGDGSYTYETGKDLDLETGHSDHASAFYMYATQAAEVTVDEETGRVRILRISAAHDVGKAINPLNCEAQIEGGLAMGIGAALHEEQVIDEKGKVRNPSFLDYHLVTSLDLPEMIPIIVECAEPEGPYGAKGLGEPGLAPTPAAIGNAVADALGVRIYDLPLTPERVYRVIQGRKKREAA